MDLNIAKSQRLSLLLAGLRRSRTWVELDSIFMLGTDPYGPDAAKDTGLEHRFAQAHQAVDRLSEHYGVPCSDIWSHVIEDAPLADVELGDISAAS